LGGVECGESEKAMTRNEEGRRRPAQTINRSRIAEAAGFLYDTGGGNVFLVAAAEILECRAEKAEREERYHVARELRHLAFQLRAEAKGQLVVF
jgi:hypothetical protein